MISKTDGSGTAILTFNEENQLTQVALSGGLTVNYKYDGLGRRIQRTTSAGANERHVYDGADVLIDLNADWSVATTYFNDLGIDHHLRQTNSTTGVSYFLTDQLGSTAALTDVGGNLVEQLTYDSFGNSPGSTRTRYGFTGRERDPDTGLSFYRSRWYDSGVGRFISEDPIRFRGGINWYDYVHNNPLAWIDPLGWAKYIYWPAGGESKYGHAALLLEDGTYISYWPTCYFGGKDPQILKHCPPRPPSYKQDLEDSKDRKPRSIQIDGLDEAAIKRWWNEGKGHGDFSLWNNCSDIVAEALRVGGLQIDKIRTYATPDYLRREIETELRDREQRRNPHPPIPKPGSDPTRCGGRCE